MLAVLGLHCCAGVSRVGLAGSSLLRGSFSCWPCWVFTAARVFLVAASRGCSLALVCGLPLAVASLAAEPGL